MSDCRNATHGLRPQLPLTERDREQVASLSRERDAELCQAGWKALAARWRAEGKLAPLSEAISFGVKFESWTLQGVRETTRAENLLAFLALDRLLRGTMPVLSRLFRGRRARPISTSEWLPSRWRPQALAAEKGVSKGDDFQRLFHAPVRMASSNTYTYSQERMWERVFETHRPISEIARSINGSYLTGNIQDLELAQRFVFFYRKLPYFRHPGALAKAAQESFEYRMGLIPGRDPIGLPHILQLLEWKQTSPWMASLHQDVREGNLEILLKFREELDSLYSHPSSSLFIPPNHSPTKLPQLWIMEMTTHLEPEAQARQLLKRASDLVHEYEDYRHYRELDMRNPQQKLRAEMRSWLEEYLFRMHHGDLGFIHVVHLENPREFGMYFRRWVENLYLRKW